jgi:hypothetical protein
MNKRILAASFVVTVSSVVLAGCGSSAPHTENPPGPEPEMHGNPPGPPDEPHSNPPPPNPPGTETPEEPSSEATDEVGPAANPPPPEK